MSLMPSPVFRWFVPAQNGMGLVPAAGYKAKFYSSGTDIAKTIYEDANLNTPYPSPSNVAVLNAEGFALIYLGPGVYKLVVTDSADSVVWTQDNIQGDGSFGTGFADSFAALADVNPLLNKYCYVGGYSVPGDGGQGMFYNKVSDVASDGGYTLQSNVDPTYVWFRIPDESGDVRAAAFGYIPTSGTVQTTQLQAADNYATSIGARLVIEAGSDAQVGVVTFNAPYVHFEPGARLKGVASPPQPAITFNRIVTGPDEQIFAYRAGSLSVTVTFSDYQVSQNPQWFGATTSNIAADNDAPFASWVAAGGGAFVLPPGSWNITDAKALLTSVQGIGINCLGVLNGNTYVFGPGTWNSAYIRLGSVLFSNDRYISFDGAYTLTTDMDWSIGRDLILGRKVVGDLYVESGVHAGTFLYDLGRGNGVGQWGDFSTTLTKVDGTGTLSSIVYSSVRFMQVGRTITVSFVITFTVSGSSGSGPTGFHLTMPAGISLANAPFTSGAPCIGAVSTGPPTSEGSGYIIPYDANTVIITTVAFTDGVLQSLNGSFTAESIVID